MPRPCFCNNYQPGTPLREGQCRVCWRYHQDLPFHRAHRGTGAWQGNTIVEAGVAEPPGLLRKAVNLAGAVAQHVMAGMQQATPEVKRLRLKICETCIGHGGFWDPVKRICKHKACGCNVEAKAAMAEQKCPIGRW